MTEFNINQALLIKCPVFVVNSNEPKVIQDELAAHAIAYGRLLIGYNVVSGVRVLPLVETTPDGDEEFVVNIDDRGRIRTDDGGQYSLNDLGLTLPDQAARITPPEIPFFLAQTVTRSAIIVVGAIGRSLDNPMIQARIDDLLDKLPRRSMGLVDTDSNGTPKKVHVTVVIIDAGVTVPDYLSGRVPVIDYGLPDHAMLMDITNRAVDACQTSEQMYCALSDRGEENIAEALRGMTYSEAARAMQVIILDNGGIADTPDILESLRDQRITTVNQNPALTVWDISDLDINSIVGLDRLQEIILEIVDALDPAAQEFGAQTPRGLVLIGPPGTGKTEASKVIAALMGKLCVRLDMSQVFAASGGLVGQSENAMRRAQEVINSLGDSCVVQLDEFDRMLSQNGGLDGGTSARVVAQMLTWMESESEVALFIATANSANVDPAMMQRLGRPILVDLPGPEARKAGLRLFFSQNQGRDVDAMGLDLDRAAALSCGYSQRELQQVVVTAINKAWRKHRGAQDVDDEILAEAIRDTVSTSVTKPDQVWQMRAMADEGSILRASSELCDWTPEYRQPTGGGDPGDELTDIFADFNKGS